MKALLEKAWNGTEAELTQAAGRIKALPRDNEGVFIMEEVDKNVYKAGILVYPVYMEYETQYNKKAGYMDIASQMQVLAKRVKADYSTETVADFLKVLVDTLQVTSPEIYEHYRVLQDLLKEMVKMMVEKENLEMTMFPTKRLKTDVSGKNKEALKLAGTAMVAACEKGFLFAEKYESLGQELATLA
ncbi:MAG: hypothetical protein J6B90_04155 [Lachnospiraceae bacterium]|nr:hypothetical protein [Lachnospiraceae bacterium]